MIRKLTFLSVIILALCVYAQDWTMPLMIYSGDMADTVTVSFGIDYRASDNHDTGIDLAFPVAPPSGMYAYFPVSDPDHPGIDMLASDIRSSYSEFEEWELHIERDMSSGTRIVVWNEEDLPIEESLLLAWADELLIGSAYPGDSVEEWTSMLSASMIEPLAGEIVWIRATMSPEYNMPPEITEFIPYEDAVEIGVDEPIEFTIVDDTLDVEITSLTIIVNGDLVEYEDFEYSPVLHGYEVSYIPDEGWEPATEYCIDIVAQDIASPPAIMDTFHRCFTTEDMYPDTLAPYYQRASIEDGAENVFVYQHLNLEIRDLEAGVDNGSIDVYVNDERYTNIIIANIPGHAHDYNLDVIPPEYGWELCTPYEITIEACDLSSDINCSTHSISFTTTCDPMGEWTYRLKTWIVNDDDTLHNFLTIGTNSEATEMYDHGIDVPITMPEFASYGYLPIDDPEYPMYRRLQNDIRRNAERITWQINYHNPIDNCGIDWNVSELYDLEDILGGEFKIGYGTDTRHISWFDMTHTNRLTFDPGEIVLIKYEYGSTDTLPPEFTNISPEPSELELGMPEITDFSVDIVDAESGVDASSIAMYINDEMVEPEYLAMSLLSRGFRVTYTPPEPLGYEVYDFRVEACDNNRPAGNCGEYEWTYDLIPCLPEFGLDFQVFDINTHGDTLSNATLRIGIDEDALVGRDDFDSPTFRPPTGTFFYMPIDDEAYDYLGADFRPACDSAQIWHIINQGVTGGRMRISWDRDEVFEDDRWELGIVAGPIGGDVPEDEEFISMSSNDYFTYAASQTVYIKTLPYIPPTFCLTGSVSFCADSTTRPTLYISELGYEEILPDGGGDFEICNLHNGIYEVIIAAEGYDSATYIIEIDGDDYAMEGHQFCNRVNLNGSLSLDDEVMPYAPVSLDGIVDTTNVDGEFAFENMIPGTYEICFSALGVCYPDTCFDIVIDSDMELDFNYESPSLNITGHIEYDSIPAEGAMIYLCDSPGIVVAETDEFGNYLIEEIACGTQCFEIHYEDFPVLDTSLFVHTDTIVDIEYFGDYNYDISGSITLDCGYTPFGTIIEIGDESAVADSFGDFEFEDIPMGEYEMQITREYAATIDTIINLESDTSLAFMMQCLPEVADIDVEGFDIERPYESGEFNIHVSWEAPITDVEIESYNIYRSESYFARPEDGTLIATLDSVIDFYDRDISPDVSYFYGIEVTYAVEPYNGKFSDVEHDMSTVSPDPNELLIIDFDDGATPIDGSGAEAAMLDLMESPALGYDGGITITSQNPENLDGYMLDDYDIVFVELGIDDDDNPLMPVSIVDQLLDFIDGSGLIYVEGPDFGKLYREAGGDYEEFFRAFGIGWAASSDGYDEGIGNVESIIGFESFFGDEISASYATHTPADRSVDELRPMEASEIITSQNDSKTRTTYYQDGGMQLIASSIYLTAVQGRATQAQIMGRYLGIDNIQENEIAVPEDITVDIAPNPFNPITSINVKLANTAETVLEIYDINGKKITTIFEGKLPAGNHIFDFDGRELSSGIYFANVKTNEDIISMRMILIK
ncbi:MAG: T9SS type A sorting domain-containing protein [Candidatus Zixiibacteriota bacterium]